MPFMRLMIFFLISFVKNFYNEWVLDSVRCFSSLIEMIYGFLFHSANVVKYSDRFLKVKTTLYSSINPLGHCALAFSYCWIQVAKTFLKILYHILRVLVCNTSLLLMSLLSFLTRVKLLLKFRNCFVFF